MQEYKEVKRIFILATYKASIAGLQRVVTERVPYLWDMDDKALECYIESQSSNAEAEFELHEILSKKKIIYTYLVDMDSL